MSWLLVVGAVWVVIAVVMAMVIGRSIHNADVQAAAAREAAANERVEPTAVVDAADPPAAPSPDESKPAIPHSRHPVVGGHIPASGRAPASRRSRRG